MPDPVRSFGAARDYLQQKFGGLFEELESTPTCHAAAGSVIGNNADRLALLIVNLGANTAYFGLKQSVSSSAGIGLPGNGASLSLTVDEDFTLTTRELFGTSPGGDSQLYVLELVRDITTPRS